MDLIEKIDGLVAKLVDVGDSTAVIIDVEASLIAKIRASLADILPPGIVIPDEPPIDSASSVTELLAHVEELGECTLETVVALRNEIAQAAVSSAQDFARVMRGLGAEPFSAHELREVESAVKNAAAAELVRQRKRFVEEIVPDYMRDATRTIKGAARSVMRAEKKARAEVLVFLADHGFSRGQIVVGCTLSGLTLTAFLAFILIGLWTFGDVERAADSIIGVILTGSTALGASAAQAKQDGERTRKMVQRLLTIYWARRTPEVKTFSTRDPIETVPGIFEVPSELPLFKAGLDLAKLSDKDV